MNIVVTGATGFVGQHLLEEIRRTDRSSGIRILSRKSSPALRCADGVEVFTGDLSQPSTIERLFAGVDVVVNCAAEPRDPDRFAATNIAGTKNILTLAERHDVRKIIHLSSVGVVGAQYSFSPLSVTEETTCSPKNRYEATKRESEQLFLEAARSRGFGLVVLRPTNVFGEYHPGRALLHLMRHVKACRPVACSENCRVNYVCVRDVAAAIVHCIGNDWPDTVVNVGASMGLKDFIRSVVAGLAVPARIISIPAMVVRLIELGTRIGSNPVNRKVRSISNAVSYDDQRLRRVTGYPYGIEDGLKRTIAYYRSAGQL